VAWDNDHLEADPVADDMIISGQHVAVKEPACAVGHVTVGIIG
jgi:hypothetical protein